MYFVCYIQLWIPSLLLVFYVGLGSPGNGRASISGSLAVTICGSMKAFSETRQVAGLLKTPHQFLVGAGQKSDSKICRVVKWKTCNDCLKFSYVSCNNAEKLFSGKASSKSSRIVNGRDVYPNEFPFLVSIVDKKSGHFCGGSIYNKDWVISAAHCFRYAEYSGIESYNVIAGDRILSITESTEQRVNFKSLVIHEEYGPDMLNDMALVQVSPPFEFNSAVAPIRLVSKTYELKVGQVVRVSGWGKLGSNYSVTSDMAKTLDLRVISNEECQDAYPRDFHNVTEDTVCAASLSSNRSGPCTGDSGGPLFVDKDEDGSRFLVGVVSGGRISDCGGITSPSWYCRITHHNDWIVSHAI